MQNSLFDLENHYTSLSKTEDPLEQLNAIIKTGRYFTPSLSALTLKNAKARLDASPYAAS